MGVINLAHGSFYMIGAYMAFALAPWVEQMLAKGVEAFYPEVVLTFAVGDYVAPYADRGAQLVKTYYCDEGFEEALAAATEAVSAPDDRTILRPGAVRPVAAKVWRKLSFM